MGTLVLSDVLANINEYENHLVVYIASDREPGPDSEIELVDYAGPQTPKPAGKRYLLGIEDIRVVLDTWSKWRGGRAPNDSERCEAVVFYAQYDGFIPVK